MEAAIAYALLQGVYAPRGGMYFWRSREDSPVTGCFGDELAQCMEKNPKLRMPPSYRRTDTRPAEQEKPR